MKTLIQVFWEFEGDENQENEFCIIELLYIAYLAENSLSQSSGWLPNGIWVSWTGLVSGI